MEHAVVDGNKGGSTWRRQHAFRIVLIMMFIVATMFLADTYDRYHPSPNLQLVRRILDRTTPEDILENHELPYHDSSSALVQAARTKKDTDVPDLIDQSSMGTDRESFSLVDVTHDDPFEVMRRLKKGKKTKKKKKAKARLSPSSSTKAPSKARPLKIVIEGPGQGKGGRPLQAPSGLRTFGGKGKAVKVSSGKGKKQGRGRSRVGPRIFV